MREFKIKFQNSAAAKQHRGMDGLQHKHSHDWHGVIRPMEKQQARENKQKKTMNKRAEEQACHSNGYVVPTQHHLQHLEKVVSACALDRP